jgi:hypothetical protein
MNGCQQLVCAKPEPPAQVVQSWQATGRHWVMGSGFASFAGLDLTTTSCQKCRTGLDRYLLIFVSLFAKVLPKASFARLLAVLGCRIYAVTTYHFKT